MDAALRKNMEAQRDRLLDQLTDIEEMKEELDADEYEATKKDTLDQLKEFETSLAKMVAGDMTLQSELEATRMAVRAAISESFKTPEVIRMFAKKEPAALRRRLAEIDRDVKLGKLDFSTVSSQAAEILVALKKLGEPLEPKEEVRARPHGSHPFLLLCANASHLSLPALLSAHHRISWRSTNRRRSPILRRSPTTAGMSKTFRAAAAERKRTHVNEKTL